MRQLLITILCLISITPSYAQPSLKIDHYKTHSFNVVIFPGDFPLPIDSLFKRFTPQKSEIDIAEKKLRTYITKSSHKSFPGDDSDAYFFSDLRQNYKHCNKQYFGCIDKKGNKFLLVNAFFDSYYFDTVLLNWLHEPISIPGASYGPDDEHNWSAAFDLTSQTYTQVQWNHFIFSIPQPSPGIDHYKTKDFDVAIFSKKNGILIDTSLKRFTPEREEIEKAELAIRRENYNKYGKRQYLGYFDNNHNKILIINDFYIPQIDFFWLKVPMVLPNAADSGWSVKYNVNTNQFQDYKNGTTCDCLNYRGTCNYRTDSSNVGIFPYYAECEHIDHRFKRFTPTVQQVSLVETKMQELKKVGHITDTSDSNFICRHFSNYQRQYFGYINKNKHKILFINCFCEPEGGDSKCGPFGRIGSFLSGELIVCDGGSCFWKVYYDIDTGKFFYLSVNGEA